MRETKARAACNLRRGLCLRRSLLALLIVVLVILLLPYLIVPLYRFVDPVSMPMLWRSVTGRRVERIFVPLSHMAPSLPLTVIISEDGSFCRNRGIDLGAMREALRQADDDLGEARGGSTITQQTAKNLFFWQGRSLVRKALEIPLALWINLVLPKRRVLEIYLNIVDVGSERRIRRRGGVPLGVRQVGTRPQPAGSGGTCGHPAESGAPQRQDAERPGAPACRPL